MTEPRALYDHQAERMWLGACWASHGRILDDTTVTADDFQHPAHRRLYDAMRDMHTGGVPYDPAGITRTLGPDLAHTNTALTDIVTTGAIPASAGWHAGVLTRLSAHRRTIEAAARITQAANGDRDPDELAELARQQLDAAEQAQATHDQRTWADVLDQSLTRWQTPVTDAIATGWSELDDMLSGGGLRPGHLTVVGARPGIGKSLVATMLAGRTAAADHGVYFASVEMSTDELTDRIAAAATGVNLADLTNRTLNDQQLADLQAGVARLRRWPLHIDDRATTIGHIRRGARRVKHTPAGLGLVLIDYLQILDGKPDKGASREQVVAGMSRALKLMSKELEVPVVVLSQLRRPGDRAEKRPMLTDLRESGAVEQDADEVLLLHRDDNDPDLAGKIEVNLAKNRHGRTGTVHLRWQPYISRITDLPTWSAA